MRPALYNTRRQLRMSEGWLSHVCRLDTALSRLVSFSDSRFQNDHAEANVADVSTSSGTDEYTRIFDLFERTIGKPGSLGNATSR